MPTRTRENQADAKEAKPAGKPKPDVRQRIAEDAAEFYDEKIRGFFSDALEAEKVAWADCPKCRHRVKLQVEDWNARVRALQVLLDQGYGRPSATEEEKHVTITVQRPSGPLPADWVPVPAETRRLTALGWTPPPASERRASDETRRVAPPVTRSSE